MPSLVDNVKHIPAPSPYSDKPAYCLPSHVTTEYATSSARITAICEPIIDATLRKPLVQQTFVEYDQEWRTGRNHLGQIVTRKGDVTTDKVQLAWEDWEAVLHVGLPHRDDSLNIPDLFFPKPPNRSVGPHDPASG
jgi:hypothetical protein